MPRRKAAITTRILGLVHQLCAKRIHVTKRDLFYTDVKLFEVHQLERSPGDAGCVGRLEEEDAWALRTRSHTGDALCQPT